MIALAKNNAVANGGRPPRSAEEAFQEIVGWARQGKVWRSPAGEELLAEVYPTVLEWGRSALSRLRRRIADYDEEDAAQEWIVKMTTRGGFARCAPGLPFTPFGRQAMENICRNWMRHIRVRNECRLGDDVVSVADDPATLTLVVELEQRIEWAIGCLPPDEQFAIVSQYRDNLSAEEAAEKAGTTPQAMHSRRCRARRRLAGILGDLAKDEVESVRKK